MSSLQNDKPKSKSSVLRESLSPHKSTKHKRRRTTTSVVIYKPSVYLYISLFSLLSVYALYLMQFLEQDKTTLHISLFSSMTIFLLLSCFGLVRLLIKLPNAITSSSKTLAPAIPQDDSVQLLLEELVEKDKRSVAAELALVRSEANFTAIFNSANQAFALFNREGEVVALNRRAKELQRRLFSWIDDHDTLENMVLPELLREWQKFFASALSGENMSTEQYIPHIDQWFECILAPVHEKKQITGVCLSVLDVTERKRAEEALAKSEANFRSLVQNSSDLLTIISSEGSILYQSPSSLRILGRGADNMIGQNMFDYLHASEVMQMQQVFDTIEDTQTEYGPLEHRYKHANDEWVFVESILNQLPASSDTQGIVLNTRDITERKRAQEALKLSEGRNRALLNAMPDVIFRFQADGELLDVKIPPDSRIQHTEEQHIRSFLPEKIAAQTLQYGKQALETKKPQLFEYQMQQDDMRDYEMRLVVSGRDEVFGIIRDISDQKTLERELISTKEAALKASRIKSEFLANMSHEIRTPMNGVIGATELLEATELPPKPNELVGIIRKSGEVLLAIINDILDFSKIEADKLHLEAIHFSLRQTVSQVLKLLTAQVEKKGLLSEVIIEEDVFDAFIGDPGRLGQILLNLLSNAIKFTEQGEVTLHIKKKQQDPKFTKLYFEVKDTGIGLAPELKETLFEPFSQADSSTTRKYGGTGLGLAICKRLTSMMNGEIGVHSELGHGSTFWFTVQLERQSHPTPPPPSMQAENNKLIATSPRPTYSSQQPPCVLVAEDNIINQTVAIKLLKMLGYRAELAVNGKEAVQAATHQSYAAILMDCQMPELDGYQATKEIRRLEEENPQRPHIPIIAMTANAMEGDREKALNAGMDDYIAKPVRREILHSILRQWVPVSYQ